MANQKLTLALLNETMQHYRKWFILGTIALAILLYGPLLNADFVRDDWSHIEANRVRNSYDFLRIFSSPNLVDDLSHSEYTY